MNECALELKGGNILWLISFGALYIVGLMILDIEKSIKGTVAILMVVIGVAGFFNAVSNVLWKKYYAKLRKTKRRKDLNIN